MFAKDKPTKRITLPGDHWVELQYLSKGQKNLLQAEITKVFKKFDPKLLDGKTKDINMEFSEDFVARIQEIEYMKLQYAIRSWSASEPVSIESIKELDDETYDIILDVVNEMNGLSEDEQKN